MDWELEQVPFTLTNDLPSTQSLEGDKFEDVFPKHIVLVLDVVINSRESFTYLHSNKYYSLCPNLFDGPDRIEFIHDYLAKYSSNSNVVRVHIDGEWETKDEGNVMTPFASFHKNKVPLHVGEERDAYGILPNNIASYDLS
jgi:hypothetical protein